MRIIYALGLLIPFGCSSNLDIMEDHQAVPVIWAIINPYDSLHYVRVQKTFKINAKEEWATLNHDSLHFHDVEVFVNGKKGDSIIWVEEFSPTRADKNDGFFPTEGYEVFRLDHILPINLSEPLSQYDYGIPDIDSLILEVEIHDLNLTAKASAPVLAPGKIRSYTGPNWLIVYGDRPSIFGLPLLQEQSGPAYMQIEFWVHFKEHIDNTFVDQHIHWMTNTGFDGVTYIMTPQRLFNRMKMLIQKNDSVVARTLDSIDVAIIRADSFFSDYWPVREHWEESDRPPYSNFDKAYGMFITIRSGKLTGLILDRRSMDSLCNGYYYSEMKFRSW